MLSAARVTLASVVLAGSTFLFAIAADAGAAGPPVGKITAELTGTETHYTASFADPDGGSVSYEWFGFTDCGVFFPANPDWDQARWSHPEGSLENGGCPHENGESESHPGVVVLKVTDESDTYTECSYEGSLSGEVSCPGGQSSPSPTTTPNTSPSPPPPKAAVCPGYEGSSKEHVVGTGKSETLTGTSASEVLCGLGGDDVIYGRADDDVLVGGRGRDRLVGGTGHDRCLGGRGKDRIGKSCEER